jgi:hypothetical protein
MLGVYVLLVSSSKFTVYLTIDLIDHSLLEVLDLAPRLDDKLSVTLTGSVSSFSTLVSYLSSLVSLSELQTHGQPQACWHA